ncbi:hypothetical protein BJY16_005842 [Actinoplanes octamycinicus]|uniref:HEAT repeat protein n=1 Tax=Actinoplanes octamycinicus TaxID=135948 RepID=A0A7W7M9U1_9ACTN|nr:HEAT repeat domain-containing protein [Actinoplanes octamycinicus]MBB4742383.1 hypothetical protein [Actinoplanes octamycinicus]
MINGVDKDAQPDNRRRTEEEWDALFVANDVRVWSAGLRAAGEPDLDRVEWGRFRHWRGPADDVPDLLRCAAGPDPEEAREALSLLWDGLIRDSCTSAPAALAVPFLLRLAADPAAQGRIEALYLAAWAGHRVRFAVETRSTLFRVESPLDQFSIGPGEADRSDWSIQAAREALGADAQILIELANDDDSDMRIAAVFALATALELPRVADDAVRARLAVEPDPAVRVSLVLAIGQLGGDAGEAERWWRDPARPDDVRFAAALAWLCIAELPASADVTTLLAESTTPEMEQVMLRVPWAEFATPGSMPMLPPSPWPDDPPRAASTGWLAEWLAGLLDDAHRESVQESMPKAGWPFFGQGGAAGVRETWG